MLGKIAIDGVDEDDSAVQSTDVLFNDTNDKENPLGTAYGGYTRNGIRVWDFDGSIPVAHKFISAFRRPVAYCCTKCAKLWVTPNTIGQSERK